MRRRKAGSVTVSRLRLVAMIEHVPQRHLDLLAGDQREIVDLVLHRRDEAVEQLLRRDPLAAEVVDQEHAAVGLQVRRRFVERRVGL